MGKWTVDPTLRTCACGVQFLGRGRAKWCSDRCRKDTSYLRHCLDCGARISSSNGHGSGAPVRCASCAAAARTWTREMVVDAMHRFAERYGRPPRAADFQPSLAAQRHSVSEPLRRERYYGDGDYPSTVTVIKVWGSWNAGVRAAGFDPFDHGRDHDWARNRPSERLAA